MTKEMSWLRNLIHPTNIPSFGYIYWLRNLKPTAPLCLVLLFVFRFSKDSSNKCLDWRAQHIEYVMIFFFFSFVTRWKRYKICNAFPIITVGSLIGPLVQGSADVLDSTIILIFYIIHCFLCQTCLSIPSVIFSIRYHRNVFTC